MKWKLFSSNGTRNAPDTKRQKVCKFGDLKLTKKDIVKLAGMVVYGVVLMAAMLVIPRIETVQASTMQVDPTPTPEVAVTADQTEDPVVEEPLDMQADETLALAMGVDAVISSVPGGERANDVTMVMVANVIVNRAEHSRYPGTIEEVLCQPMQFSCFAETGVKWVGRAADDESFKQRCMKAAERVISGERMLSPNVVYVSSSRQGTVEAQLDGLYFCK